VDEPGMAKGGARARWQCSVKACGREEA